MLRHFNIGNLMDVSNNQNLNCWDYWLCQQVGSAGKGTWHQAFWPEFQLWDLHGGKRETVLISCSLTTTHNICAHTHPNTHVHTYTCTKIWINVINILDKCSGFCLNITFFKIMKFAEDKYNWKNIPDLQRQILARILDFNFHLSVELVYGMNLEKKQWKV